MAARTSLLAFADDPQLHDTVKVAMGLPDAAVRPLVVELLRYLRLAARNPSYDLSPSPDVDAAWHALLSIPQLYLVVCAAGKGDGGASTSAAASSSFVVPHFPWRARDADAVRRARYEATMALYEDEYLAPAPEAQWPRNYALPAAAAAAAASSASSKRMAAAAAVGGGSTAASAATCAPPAKRGKVDAAPAAFRVTVLLEGRTLRLDVEPSFTVEDLKRNALRKAGILEDSRGYSLISGGVKLWAGSSLAEENISSDDPLELMRPQFGC